MNRLFETENGKKVEVPVGKWYPVTWRLIRFPREEESHQHSMVRVWHVLFRIAAGEKVDPDACILACRWFGVLSMTKDIAKQLTRQGSDMRIRFPRRHRHG